VFSTLAAQTDCTATRPPGGGSAGGGNNPPERYQTAGSWVGRGKIDVSSWPTLTYTSTLWFGGGNVTDPATGCGKAQIVAVNATPATGVTPDGTFWVVVGTPATATNSSMGWMYGRVDDLEDGDVDLWAWWCPQDGAYSAASFLINNNNSSGDKNTWGNRQNWGESNTNVSTGYVGVFTTTKRRGYAAGGTDAGYVYGHMASICYLYTSRYSVMFGGDGGYNLAHGIPMRVYDHPLNPSGTAPLVRESVWLAGDCVYKKFFKGTMRWMWYTSIGTAYDMYDSKSWMQVCNADTSSGYVGLVLGPWDGSTIPLNA
jgi:hypothetical protein